MGKIIRALRWLGKHKIDTSDMFPSLVLLVSFFLVISIAFAVSGQKADISFEIPRKACRISFKGGNLQLFLKKHETADVEKLNRDLLKRNKQLLQREKELSDKNVEINKVLNIWEDKKNKLEGEVSDLKWKLEWEKKNKRIIKEDLDGDGIDEFVLWETKSHSSGKMRGLKITNITIFSSKGKRHSLKFEGWLEDPVVEDLNNDGLKEIMITRIWGNSRAGKTIIVYNDGLHFWNLDTEYLGSRPLRLEKYGKKKKYLVLYRELYASCFCNAAQIYIPCLYQWNGRSVIGADLSVKKEYYEKHYIPKQKARVAEIAKNLKKDKEYRDYYSKSVQYEESGIKIVKEIMTGRVEDEAGFISNFKWRSKDANDV